MNKPRPAVPRTVLVVDVAGFGTRTNRDQVAVHAGLYRIMTRAFERAGVSWEACEHGDRGDGVLVVIPPEIAPAPLVESLPDKLVDELAEHNATHDIQERIRLRMALHAGDVHYDEHGVIGHAVNLAFRLIDAPACKAVLAGTDALLAVIVSSRFHDEVVAHTRPDVRENYQQVRVVSKETSTVAWICLPGVNPSEWDTGRPTPAKVPAPHQLPPRGRLFVGRTRELDRLDTLLDDTRAESGTVIITAIAGTAGIGKTALATYWAHRVKDRFPDGQLYVNLRGFDPHDRVDPSQALHGFLEALGIMPTGIPADPDARAARYRSLVADRRMLIMLDNVRSADQVRALLPNAPTCVVIVTSRNSLDSLVVREGAHRIVLDVLTAPDAFELLAQRLTLKRLDAEPLATVDLIDLCARLPLALSIVAARAAGQPGLRLRELVRQLRDERTRLDALDLGDTDLDVRAVFSWSYRELGAPAKRLFRLLGLHPGPDVDAQACAAIVGTSAGKIGATLRELTNSYLLEEYRPGRFRFHDLLRAYAAERADEDETEPDRAAAIRRVVDYYAKAALLADYRINPCRAERRPAPSADWHPAITTRAEAMPWFHAETATLQSIVIFAARHGLDAQVESLAWGCTTFLRHSGQRFERAAMHRTALDAARHAGDRAAQVRALVELSRATGRLGQFAEAMAHLDEASALNKVLGDGYDECGIEIAFARVFAYQLRHAEALAHARRAWELAEREPSERIRAEALLSMARQHAALGQGDEALPVAERALEMYSAIGHRPGEAYALGTLGLVHETLGNHEDAIAYHERSLALDHQLGYRYWEAVEHVQLGDIYQTVGRLADALAAFQDALAILESLAHPEAKLVRDKLRRSGVALISRAIRSA